VAEGAEGGPATIGKNPPSNRGIDGLITPDCSAGSSNLFQKNNIECAKNSAVDTKDVCENPNGHEKKYTLNKVKYRKNVRGKNRMDSCVRMLVSSSVIRMWQKEKSRDDIHQCENH